MLAETNATGAGMSSKKLHQSPNIVRITVPKWLEYNREAKGRHWFPMATNCIRHPVLQDLPPSFKMFWWYILTRCAESNSSEITLNLRDAAHVIGCHLRVTRDALEFYMGATWCLHGAYMGSHCIDNLSESLDPKIHRQTDRQTDRQTLGENPTSSSVNSVKDFQDRFLTPSAEETEIWNLLEPMIPKHDHKRWKPLVKKILVHWGKPNDFSNWLEQAFSNNKTFLALDTPYAQWKYIARSIQNQLTEVGA